MTLMNSRWARSAATSLAFSTVILAGCGDNDVDTIPPPDSGTTATAIHASQTNLVTDVAMAGATTDPNLINPWGIAVNPAGPIWVSDNGTGVATVYDRKGAIQPIVVTVPVPAGVMGPAKPTGQVFNAAASDFLGDVFIMSTEQGAIVGWQSGMTATLRADNSASGAIYKGLAVLDTGSGRVILAANFAKNQIDMFDTSYKMIRPAPGQFVDPSLPAGFAPFNVFVSGDLVYVAYAKQGATMEDDVAGPGNGVIDVFSRNGTSVRRLVAGGALDSPWGMMIVPSTFSALAGDLLVGNFGDGRITAFNPMTGAMLLQLQDTRGNPLVIPGLWALVPNPGAANLQILFSAGPDKEMHGILGTLTLTR